MLEQVRATVVPILRGLLFFSLVMGVSQGIVALNAGLSPAIPWFPVPILGLVYAGTRWANRRWPLRLGRPVGARAYAVTLLMTYAVLCLGVVESWWHELTLPAPAWPDESVSSGFQLTFLIILPFIAAVLAEVGFRGLMQTALEKVVPLWPMLLLIAVINFLMHFYDPEQVNQVVRLLALNIVWGYMTWRVQSLRPALTGHIAMNIVIPVWHYASERYGPGPLAVGDFSTTTLAIAVLSGAVAMLVALFMSKGLPVRS